MAFEIPENLHPDCGPIAWMLGTWRGNGHGDYPTIETFQFGQELIFQQDGRPFFHYMAARGSSTTRATRSATPRRRPASSGRPEGKVEVLLAHMTGFVEIWYGDADGGKLEIVTDAVARTDSAKEYVGGKRLYGNVEGDLLYAYDMAAMGQPLQPHLWARLQRA